jgi:hypothetical protein
MLHFDLFIFMFENRIADFLELRGLLFGVFVVLLVLTDEFLFARSVVASSSFLSQQRLALSFSTCVLVPSPHNHRCGYNDKEKDQPNEAEQEDQEDSPEPVQPKSFGRFSFAMHVCRGRVNEINHNLHNIESFGPPKPD